MIKYYSEKKRQVKKMKQKIIDKKNYPKNSIWELFGLHWQSKKNYPGIFARRFIYIYKTFYEQKRLAQNNKNV